MASLPDELAVGAVPDSDWNMLRCEGSSSRSETGRREVRFSREAIGTWKPSDEKGANGEESGCGSGVLSALQYAGEYGNEDEVEVAAGLKSLLSRATERDGKLPGLRAPPAGKTLFPILGIVDCLASGTSPA